ncbi:MAG: SUMF1/EgtB/PvdO family nonheme iron enzyme [Cytophagales bacterium]|nr:SUMF1/EgtB/PvdO family nonheme iron enzyme [Cytophagales bacterium]
MSANLAHEINDPLVKAYERFAKKMSGYEYVANDGDPGASFLMSTSEITNFDYLEFLYQTKQQKGLEAYHQMLPDTSLWREVPPFGETLEVTYHNHPAYHKYPVVNITHDQAKEYCAWLQDVLSQNELVNGYQVQVKLPSVEEWTYAATGGGDDDNKLPWSGLELEHEGQTRAFYNKISQFDILRDEEDSIKIYDSSYYYPYPQRYGIFMGDVHQLETGFWDLAHMAGNAAEFIEEKGVTKGGSWRDPAYYLMNRVLQTYEGSGASISNGFRVLVKLIPEEVN